MKDAFCQKRIINNQAYYKTKYLYVLYNIKPILPGHSLIIPKRHVEFLHELKDEEWLEVIKVIRKVVPVLLKRYKADNSYNVAINVGPYSGRVVNHLHIHIIPRNKNDKYSKNSNRIYAGLYGDIYTVDKSTDPEKEIKELRKIFKYRD
ncbi:MAG: HIT family protein [Candidatus Micrarchaeia archaeon]